MSNEEKKVLTPEEIAMIFDLESDGIDNPIEVLIKLIREYGEQQFKEGIRSANNFDKYPDSIINRVWNGEKQNE
jgi:hypothetical protein